MADVKSKLKEQQKEEEKKLSEKKTKPTEVQEALPLDSVAPEPQAPLKKKFISEAPITEKTIADTPPKKQLTPQEQMFGPAPVEKPVEEAPVQEEAPAQEKPAEAPEVDAEKREKETKNILSKLEEDAFNAKKLLPKAAVNAINAKIKYQNELKNAKENIARNVEDYKRKRDDYFESQNNVIQRKTFLVEGETFKNFLKLALVGLGSYSGRDVYGSFQARARQEYKDAVAANDKNYQKYMQFSQLYNSAKVGELQYMKDMVENAQSVYSAVIKFSNDKTQIKNGEVQSQILAKQHEMLSIQLENEKDERAYAPAKRAQNERTHKTNIAYKNSATALNRAKLNAEGKANKVNAFKALEQMSKIQKIKDKERVKQFGPYRSAVEGEDKLLKAQKDIQSIKSTKGMIQDIDKNYINYFKKEVSGLFGLSRFKTKEGLAKIFQYIDTKPGGEKILNKIEGFKTNMMSFYAQAKEVLGLDRLSDRDVIIVQDFINAIKDGEEQDFFKPEKLNAMKKAMSIIEDRMIDTGYSSSQLVGSEGKISKDEYLKYVYGQGENKKEQSRDAADIIKPKNMQSRPTLSPNAPKYLQRQYAK